MTAESLTAPAWSTLPRRQHQLGAQAADRRVAEIERRRRARLASKELWSKAGKKGGREEKAQGSRWKIEGEATHRSTRSLWQHAGRSPLHVLLPNADTRLSCAICKLD
jgi:hypothetical protein